MRTLTSSDGLQVSLGENAAENQSLVKRARQNDVWFHLDDHASPHALLSVPGKLRSDAQLRESIHECAQLVKYFSKLRDAPHAPVIFVEAKFVSKHGVEDKTGAVTLTKAPRRLVVVFDQPCVDAMLARLEKS